VHGYEVIEKQEGPLNENSIDFLLIFIGFEWKNVGRFLQIISVAS
jgi:hypothetical protein